MLSKRKTAIEGRLRVQSRASERLQGQIIELENTKTEEAVQLAVKEHDFWMYQNEKEAKRLQGARKLRKDEESLGTTKNWPHWEEERWKKASWNLKGKRRCRKEMRWKVRSWTWMAKGHELEAKLSRRERESTTRRG